MTSKNTFYCIVAGSRYFTDYKVFAERMNFLLCNKKDIFLITGDANGTDALCRKYAVEHQIPFTICKADWKSKGKSAGFLRNKKMHEIAQKYPERGCILFWDGRTKGCGTTHHFDLCAKSKTPAKVVRLK